MNQNHSTITNSTMTNGTKTGSSSPATNDNLDQRSHGSHPTRHTAEGHSKDHMNHAHRAKAPHASQNTPTQPQQAPAPAVQVEKITFAQIAAADNAATHLHEAILRAVESEGYTHPTPIQARAIPQILAGRDMLGCAQTGTGKTAAFSLPILHLLAEGMPQAAAGAAGSDNPRSNAHRSAGKRSSGPSGPRRPIRALILSPTRELALQIDESLRTYGRNLKLRTACVFGGVGQHPQVRALQAGVDILVATPGRLIDLIEQGYIDLSAVEIFVLDEADRMLDMGFIAPIRRIAEDLPGKGDRQTLLFSATMPPAIRGLAESLLQNPAKVEVAAVSSTAEKVEQSLFYVPKRDKPALLSHMLLDLSADRVLIFTRTKHGADKVAKHLNRSGVTADAIHGNKRQNVRQRTLMDFRNGRIRALVATDVAARGIDVDGISHVFNFDLPNEPETYVHRIGRTARAGATGEAISFCDRSGDERAFLRDIEKLIKKQIRVRDDLPDLPPPAQPTPEERERELRYEGNGQGRGKGRGQGRGQVGGQRSGPRPTRAGQSGHTSRTGGGPRRAGSPAGGGEGTSSASGRPQSGPARGNAPKQQRSEAAPRVEIVRGQNGPRKLYGSQMKRGGFGGGGGGGRRSA